MGWIGSTTTGVRAIGWSVVALVAAVGGCGSDGSSSDGAPASSDGPIDAASVVADGAMPDLAPPPPPLAGDWPQYRHDVHSTWASPARCTVADAAQLAERWHVELGAYGYTQPIIVADTIYVTMGFTGTIHALALGDGSERWSRDLNHIFKPACLMGVGVPTGFYASVAVVAGVVYAASPDGQLYALDAATGATLWSAVVAAPELEFVESSPAVVPSLGKLYLGVGSVASCAPIAGRIVAVDLATHAVTARTLVPATHTGAPLWSSITVDEAAGRVYATTGDHDGWTAADDPLANSFIAFDAATLAPLDHWQDPVAALDSDFGASPTLFAAPDGTALTAAPNKDGWLYVLHRGALAAGPVWSWQLAVPGDPTDPTGGRASLVAPTVAGGRLYAAGGRTPDGRSGQVVAFPVAAAGGGSAPAPLWTHTPPGYVLAGMPSVGDVLVVAVAAVGNHTGTLEVLDAGSGAVVKSFADAAPVYGAPVAGGGVIAWLDFDGRLTAVSVGGK